MEPWRTILLLATVGGALLAAGGLIAAYRSAKREYKAAGVRVEAMGQLMKRLEADPKGDMEAYRREFAEHDLEMPTWGNLVQLALFESRRLFGNIAAGSRSQLIVAGSGLLLSTFASAASLYMATA